MSQSPGMIKPEARILDSTAANRSIWSVKDDPRIIFIDIETELELKPDLIMDCTKTKFPDNYFNMIIFDPPHDYNVPVGTSHFTLRNKKEAEAFNQKYGTNRHVTYYGSDKYKTKGSLLSFIFRAQREFKRILSKNGILLMKWTEVRIPLYQIIPLMKGWTELIRFEIKDKKQTAGDSQVYWLFLMKDLEAQK